MMLHRQVHQQKHHTSNNSGTNQYSKKSRVWICRANIFCKRTWMSPGRPSVLLGNRGTTAHQACVMRDNSLGVSRTWNLEATCWNLLLRPVMIKTCGWKTIIYYKQTHDFFPQGLRTDVFEHPLLLLEPPWNQQNLQDWYLAQVSEVSAIQISIHQCCSGKLHHNNPSTNGMGNNICIELIAM